MTEKKALRLYAVIDPVTTLPVCVTADYSTAFDLAQRINDKPAEVPESVVSVPYVMPVMVDAEEAQV